MQGHPLSKQECKYIDAHKKRKFPSVIATDLAERFPEDNGGCRDAYCIKRYLRKNP